MSIEAYVRNRIADSPDHYEVAKAQAAALFAGRNGNEIAVKLALESDEAYLYVPFFGGRYRLRRRDGLAEREEPDGSRTEAGFYEALILYDLLADSAPGAEPAMDYTPLQNLAVMHNASSYAGHGMFSETEKLFDGRTAALARACEALGGVPFGKGDVSYRIPLFRNLCAVVSFWNSDEDFPASLNFLFDTGTLSFLHYETVWYVAALLAERLEALVRSGV